MNTARRHLLLSGTPVGPLVLVADADRLVGVYMDEHRNAPDLSERTIGPEIPDDALLLSVAAQLHEYFAGQRSEFEVAVAPVGTPFRQLVWRTLQEIPYGETWTYGEVARRIGQPTASRAVGLANGRNPVSIVIPCHRVVGANGSLTGYGGGLANKEALLALERARTAAPLF